MRTTLDIPDALGRRAKLAAVRRGVSLKMLVVNALEHELDGHKTASGKQPLQFPLLSSTSPGTYDLKPEDVAGLLVREEIAAYETADRR